ncbi:NodT family efflux transporter outer membrane factor (OMF) lipoprotein [Pseudomonas nitritireducens]|uniref:NodT family efflux transporter outer membrane factor (OMF) lipoprotein n=1 Tax=Pseudomonas nitroreducens TaxID=46680 RepID=A0A7W7NZV0_PSENT|nr:TolC family protein [Pseudomonas nitritireducens]MBB4863123.1 NodT family efflux transporter outer membrane factor (OMF) lipoprotein [Pseudomonas nitritireducens]
MPKTLSHPRHLVFALASAGLLLGGCSAVSEHVSPSPDLASGGNWQALAGDTVAQEPPTNWWRLYQEPHLDQLVTQALQHNQDLQASLAHIDELLALLGQTRAQRWPSTTASWQTFYGRTSDDQTEAKATGGRAGSQWNQVPGFALDYQFDLWGRVRQSILSAQANAEAAQAAHDQLRVEVAAGTARAYANACAYAARADIQQHSLQAVERSLDLTRRQRRAGLVTELEVDRVRSLLEETRALLPRLQAEHQAALEELGVLTGSEPGHLPAAVRDCRNVPQLRQALPVGDGWALLQRRPDIRQAERELVAAGHEVGVRQADFYPSVSFGASISSSAEHLHDLGQHEAITYAIGPLISWSFPNLLTSRARLDGAQAHERQQLARFQQQALVALKEVRQSLARYHGEAGHREALGNALDSSRNAFRLAQLNYQAGALDFLDVLDSERAMVRLEADKAEADRLLVERQIDLFHALGGGWQDAPANQLANHSTSATGPAR